MQAADGVWSTRNQFLGSRLTEAGILQHPILVTAVQEYGQSDQTMHKLLFGRLWALMVFFNHVHNNNEDQALGELDQQELLPRNMGGEEMDNKVQLFEGLDAAVKNNFHHVLVGAMHCVHRLYNMPRGNNEAAREVRILAGRSLFDGQLELLRSRRTDAKCRQAYREQMKTRGQIIITFSGQIQYKVPNDTRITLLRLNSQLR